MWVQQNYPALIFATIIIAIFVAYVWMGNYQWLALKRRQNELDTCLRSADEPVFTDRYLADVYEQYVRTISSGGIEKLNTQALLDAHKPPRWYRASSMVLFCSTAVITIGLLGTFVGFYISLGGFDSALLSASSAPSGEVVTSGDQAAAAQELINSFAQSIKEPLKGINTKFATSIIGLFFAFVMNLISSLVLRPMEERFEDGFLSFLDNRIAPLHAKDTNGMLASTLDRIEENLVGNIRQFSSNVGDLNNSLDNSVSVLNGAVQSLGHTVSSLDDAIRAMARPLDAFADRIEGMGLITEKLDRQILSIESVSDVLAENVVKALSESLDRSVSNILDATEKMSSAVDLSTSQLTTAVGNSVVQLNGVMEGMKNDLQSSVSANGELQQAVQNMSESNQAIRATLQPFIDACSSLTENARVTTELVRSFIDEGVTRVRSETQTAVDTTTDRIIGHMKAGLEPTFVRLQQSADGLNGIVQEYHQNLGRIAEEMKQSYGEVNAVLQASYMDYKLSLGSYDQQVHQLSNTIEAISEYVQGYSEQVKQLSQIINELQYRSDEPDRLSFAGH